MKAQRGLAAITALLIVAVAASAAAFMLAQQSAMIDQATMVSARAQADAYAQAGFDWARGVLAEDAKRAGGHDSLDEPWAQPIAALPVERAIVSGAIGDEQGKFNLNALVRNGAAVPQEVAAFRRLLAALGLPESLADAVVDWIDTDDLVSGPGGAEDAYYLSLPRTYRAANREMVQVEELHRMRGFDAATVAKLRPYVTAIAVPANPAERPALNANTAPDAVLQALLDAPRDKLAAVLASRRQKPFTSTNDLNDRFRAAGLDAAALNLGVKSAHFLVRVAVSQDEVQLASEAFVRREASGATAIIWRRPRF